MEMLVYHTEDGWLQTTLTYWQVPQHCARAHKASTLERTAGSSNSPDEPDVSRPVEHDRRRIGAYRRALRRRDQLIFDYMFVYARDLADAAGNLNQSNPLAPMWMATTIEQEKRISELEDQVEVD